MRMFPCHYPCPQDAPSSPAPFPKKNRNEPERRATDILARPGRACKSPSALDLTNRSAFADRPRRTPACLAEKLLDFDGRDAFEFLPDGLRLVLGRAFLDRLGSAIDQVLSFLQAQRRNFTHGLDGVDLVRAKDLRKSVV